MQGCSQVLATPRKKRPADSETAPTTKKHQRKSLPSTKGCFSDLKKPEQKKLLSFVMHAHKLEKEYEVVQQEQETAETEKKESDSREKHRKMMGISFSSHISLTAMAKQFKASRGTCRHMHFTMADIIQGLQFEFLEELWMMVRPRMKDDHHIYIYIYIYIWAGRLGAKRMPSWHLWV